jgi:hypothetical protein
MLPNEKFKFEATSSTGRKVVMLRGVIDEDTDFEPIKKLGSPLVFNFKGVTSINSCGIRTWVNFLKELGKTEISYEECPPLIVRQLNMVPSFLGTARVLSVFVPYVCDNCETEKLMPVAADKFAKGTINVPEAFTCDNCKKGEMELDGQREQYFAFAK